MEIKRYNSWHERAYPYGIIGRYRRRDRGWVYILYSTKNPSIRYIGCTNHPAARFSSHVNGLKRQPVHHWSKNIAPDQIRMKLIFLGTYEEARRIESLLIQQYKTDNKNLFNFIK